MPVCSSPLPSEQTSKDWRDRRSKAASSTQALLCTQDSSARKFSSANKLSSARKLSSLYVKLPRRRSFTPRGRIARICANYTIFGADASSLTHEALAPTIESFDLKRIQRPLFLHVFIKKTCMKLNIFRRLPPLPPFTPIC